ncbi:hypothetical protein [Halomarina oriensis]|uniref:Uncharacterized protein n=1 Tax=Halomarina oriensis TaxID=671145 RepID=A0A6B0GPP9_9EURY|nr:hypothetical protein [Halomarina oriensis]MWG34075.1 hypothetical protein [Halomarina oriensis]
MPSLERLFRTVGGVGLVAGVVVTIYGFTASVDVVAMLAGVFVAFVGLSLLVAGVLWPRFEGPDGPGA